MCNGKHCFTCSLSVAQFMPTEEEIHEGTLAIQATWTERERLSRLIVKPSIHAEVIRMAEDNLRQLTDW